MDVTILAARALGAAINVVIGLIGIRAAQSLVDEVRARMAAEQRGPTDAEIDALVARIDARSSRIQDAARNAGA